MDDENKFIEFVSGMDKEVYLSQVRDICDNKDLTSEQKVFSISMIVQNAPKTKYDERLETTLFTLRTDKGVIGVYHTMDEAIKDSHKIDGNTYIEQVILRGS